MPKKTFGKYPQSDSHQFKPSKVTSFQVRQNLCLPIEYKLSNIDKSISQPEPYNNSRRQCQFVVQELSFNVIAKCVFEWMFGYP